MKAERVDIESNKAQAMELQAQMLEAERSIAKHRWMENAIKSKLDEVEDRDWRDEIEEEEVCEMDTKTNKALEEMRVDLVWFLPEESPDELVRDLTGKFAKLRDKEERLV